MKTEAIITLSLAPPESKNQVSSIGFATAQSTALLTDSSTFYTKRITGEPDLVKLDGSYQFYESPSDCCYSTVMSGADGQFYDGAAPVSLSISFAQVQKSRGITLYFGDTYAADFSVYWYGGSTQQAAKSVTENTSNPCIVTLDQDIEYDRVQVVFTKTDQPYRYLKLTEIDFGEDCVFSGDNLKSAKLLDEFDYLANEISIGKLTLTAYDKAGKLDMMNPGGLYNRLLEDQEIRCDMRITEDDGTEKEIRMGVYYLSDWKNVDRNNIQLTAGNILQKFDKTAWDYSPYYDPASQTVDAAVLFGKVFEAADFENYTVSWLVGQEPISGYIKAGTIRSALQDLCVATRSTLRVKADGSVEIYRPDPEMEPIKELTAVVGDIKCNETRKNKVDGFTVEYYVFSAGEEYTFYDYDLPESTPTKYVKRFNERYPFNYDNKTGNFICTEISAENHAGESAPQIAVADLLSEINRVSFTATLTQPYEQPEAGFVYWGHNIEGKTYSYHLNGHSPNYTISGNTLINAPYSIPSSGAFSSIASYWYNFLNKYNIEITSKAILAPVYIKDYIGIPDEQQETFWRLRAGDHAILPDQYEALKPMRYLGLYVTSVETDLTGGMIATIKGIASKEDIHVDTTEN